MTIIPGNDGYSAQARNGIIREADFVVALNKDGTQIGSASDVNITDGFGTDQTGTLTTGTSVVTSGSIDGYSTVTFSLSGTYGSLSAVFEQSDDSGVTWYPVDAIRVGTGQIDQSVVGLTNTNLIWRATISGCDSFRVRATALTSGTVAVLMSFSAIPSGAGMANYLDVAPISGSVTSATTLFTADCNGYQSISVQVTSAGTTCTITYETSDDNTTFYAIAGRAVGTVSTVSTVTTSTTLGLIIFPKTGRYFRARVSTYTSGTVTVVGNLHANPVAFSQRITVDGSTTSSTTATTNGFQNILLAGNASPTAVTNGQAVRQLGTLLGAGIVKNFSLPEGDWSYAAASGGITNTTTAVTFKTAVASNVNYVTGISYCTNGALGAATELAIRDGAAGTVIWRTAITTSGLAGGESIVFPTPLKSTAGNLLEVVTLTASITGAVYFNAQGYTAAD